MRDNWPAHPPTSPPPAYSDDKSLDHSSTPAEPPSSPRRSTRTPRSSPGTLPAQPHPPPPDAPAFHHRPPFRSPSQTNPPGCAPAPARSLRSVLRSILPRSNLPHSTLTAPPCCPIHMVHHYSGESSDVGFCLER